MCGVADRTDPTCREDRSPDMEGAPGEGVPAPPDRTIAADMLGALHNVGTAIRDSVSSMGSPLRPDSGPPQAAEQVAPDFVQQHPPAEMHATNESGGAGFNANEERPSACSAPAPTASGNNLAPHGPPVMPTSCRQENGLMRNATPPMPSFDPNRGFVGGPTMRQTQNA